MALTATQVKSLKPDPDGKTRKVSDGGGLYILLAPTGGKRWRVNYRFQGKQKTAALGTYPDVSLADARAMRDALKEELRLGNDPAEAARARKIAAAPVAEVEPDREHDTFEQLSLDYQAKRRRERAEQATMLRYEWLHRRLCAEIGHMDPMMIEPHHVLPLLQAVEMEGLLDTGARVRTYVGQVMRFGISTSRARRDPAPDLKGAIAAPTSRRHSAILEPDAFGKFLAACDGYSGHTVSVLAMQLAPLVIVRSSELREGAWDEVDFDARVWRIPQSRMKGNAPGDHIVPLSSQSVALLQKLHAVTGRRKLLFETTNSPGHPLSENTINQGYRRMGYLRNVVSLHGLRTTFSTMANEAVDDEGRRMWDRDYVERTLAHVDGTVRGVYNAAEYLGPRRRMMQWWADRCDEMRGYSIIERIQVRRTC